MKRFLSRVPRESKAAAVVLGVALLQVGLLAFFGLKSTDERREELEIALRGRAERVVDRAVVRAGRTRIAELRAAAEHELSRTDRPLRDRIAAALVEAPAFTHAFVVVTGDPLGPRLHEFRSPRLEAAPRTAIDPAARTALRELEALVISDPSAALRRGEDLAASTDDTIAQALALRFAWRAARAQHDESRALALAVRVVGEFGTVIDDRGERADHAPLGASASAVITDIWKSALLVSADTDTSAFVDAVIDRRTRAQRMRHLLSDAAYQVEREACTELRQVAQVHLPVEDLHDLDAAIKQCDRLDRASARVAAIADHDFRGALERGGGWLASGDGDDAISATLVALPAGDREDAAAVLFAAPRRGILDTFLAPLADGIDAPAGVTITVRDGSGGAVVGTTDGALLVPFRELGPAAPGVSAGAVLTDPSVLARETNRARALWLWILVGAGLAVLAASLLAVRAVMREVRLARMKGDFVSNLSHELRTPLTSMRMFVETLQDRRYRDAAEAQEYVDVIAREANRLSTLVDRILQFAAFSRGRAPIELRSSDPVEVARRAVELFQSHADAAGAVVQVEAEDDLPEALLDKDALIQVLLNLLDNAVKYGGDNGARIRVAVRAAGPRVCFEVEDDGTGVPERERELVFEEFYRGDESLTSRKQGAGIGLALCRRIVLAHGGKIAVGRGPKLGGALFRVTLPDAAAGRRLALAARAEGAG